MKIKIFIGTLLMVLIFFAAFHVYNLKNIVDGKSTIKTQKETRPRATPVNKKPQKILVKTKEEGRGEKTKYAVAEELTPQQKKLVELGFKPYGGHPISIRNN